jgi:hypothetical protein
MNREFRPKPLLTVEHLSEAAALDQLHDDCLASIVLEHVMNRNNVGVVEPSHCNCFSSESLGNNFIGRQVWLQPFNGDTSIKLFVDGNPDLGHTALTNPAVKAITPSQNLGVLKLAW